MKKKLGLLILFISYVLNAYSENYDIVVDINGSGDFTSVQKAIDAAPSNRLERTIIYIKNGTYYEVLTIDKTKTNLTFLGENVDSVILSYDNAASKINSQTGSNFGTSGSSSIFINGDGFYAKNISFENSADPSYGQAVAVRSKADKVVFLNCRFLGNQDTYYPHSGRSYHKDCYFEGTTDFIFGKGIAYFENCSIYSKGGSSITAAATPEYVEYGFVFNNCTISGTSKNITDLGRPWRPFASVTFLNCSISDVIKNQGWNNWGNDSNEKTARFAEYNNTGAGSNFSDRPEWISQLTKSEAKKYSVQNILKATNANPQVIDNWDPSKIE